MKILITGANGFLAQNAIDYFGTVHEVVAIHHNCDESQLQSICQSVDIVFHFAAVQRSDNEEDFWKGNVTYTEKLISCLEKRANKIPILFSTSIAIEKKSIFSETKLIAEKMIREYGKRNNVSVYVFKLNNLFGAHGRPNFNNVIATFCYNTANGIPITINDPTTILPLTYVNDALIDFENAIAFKESEYYYTCSVQYPRMLGEIIQDIGRAKLRLKPTDEFEEKLHKTYGSYEKTNLE